MWHSPLPRSGIYAIRCLTNGRVYVGSAVWIRKRWEAHRHLLRTGRHHSPILQRSWDKYGEAAFVFSVLEVVLELTDLVAREQVWIDALEAAGAKRGMNSSPTAGNCLGVIHSAETRQKLSAQRRGVPKSEAHRAAIGTAQIGKVISDTQRAAAAVATRQYFEEHPEARERMREVGRRNGTATKGRPVSDADRIKRSEVRKASEKFRDAARSNLAKITPEHRAKASKKIAAALRERPRHALRSFTYEQAEQIRAEKAAGATYDQLVAHHGLNRSSLFNLIHRRTYAAP